MLQIISFIFVVPFLVWLCIFLAKMQHTTKADQDMTMGKKITIIAILLFVASAFIMSSQGFYYAFLKPTGAVFLIGLIVIALCILVSGRNLGLSMIAWTIVLSLPGLVSAIFYVLLMENSYETIQSPDGQTRIVIEYRDATLGETNYFYDFYKKIPYLPIIKRLDQDAHFYTRGIYLDNLQALGAHQAKWYDGYVVFHPIEGESIKVIWKDS